MAVIVQPGEIVIGIDLGTTYSVVSLVENEEPLVIKNAEGKSKTPSVVAFTDEDHALVGEVALRQMATNPRRSISSVKRLIGRNYSDIQDREMFTYELMPDENDEILIRIDDLGYSPQQISSLILIKLKEAAEEHWGGEITKAIITVPAYFNDRQRQATIEAGQMAGLDVLRLVNEPTAAAVAYGLGRSFEGVVAVYDFGGGTFDISILEIIENSFEVLATHGDTFLGGDDIDMRIMRGVAEKFKAQHGIDLLQDPMSFRRLKEQAEQAKCYLSSAQEAVISLPFVVQTESGPLHLEETITRNDFEDMIEDLVKRTLECCRETIDSIGLKRRNIKRVILVGGSTRIPMVQEMVAEFFNQEPFKGVNPDEIVAMGAATQGAVLAGGLDEVVLMEVTPHSLGIEVKNNRVSRVIEKNSTIPLKAAKTFTTTEDFQEFVNIHVLQGEDPEASNNLSLGKFTLMDIEPVKAGEPRIEVAFFINSDGVVEISARNMLDESAEPITVRHSFLSGAEREEMRHKRHTRRHVAPPGRRADDSSVVRHIKEDAALQPKHLSEEELKKEEEKHVAEKKAPASKELDSAEVVIPRNLEPPQEMTETNVRLKKAAVPASEDEPSQTGANHTVTVGQSLDYAAMMLDDSDQPGRRRYDTPFKDKQAQPSLAAAQRPETAGPNDDTVQPDRLMPADTPEEPDDEDDVTDPWQQALHHVKHDDRDAHVQSPAPDGTGVHSSPQLLDSLPPPDQIDWPAELQALEPELSPETLAACECLTHASDPTHDEREALRKCESELEKIAFDHPESFLAAEAVMRAKMALGNPHPALIQIEQYMRANPGRLLEAQRLFRQLLKAHPHHAPAMKQYGRLYIQLNNEERGLHYLEKALEHETSDMALIEELIEQYQRQLNEQTDPVVQFKLVKLHLKRGNIDETISILQQLTNNERYQQKATKILGFCFWQKNMYYLAWQKFKNLPVTNEVKDILYRLASDMETADQLTNARYSLERILEFDYAFRDTQKRLEQISQRIRKQQQSLVLAAAKEEHSVLKDSRFVVLEEINRGSMGIIYRAKDRVLDEIVALKVLNDYLCQDPQAIERFKREARAAKRLSHPNIVRIHDMYDSTGKFFLSMEYIEGRDIKAILREKERYTWKELAPICLQICDALKYAHKLSVVHRDVKPANIMVTSADEVKVTDFGIAKLLRTEDATKSQSMIMGTPLYMSPEQVEGLSIDARSDIYSLGVMLYELLSGAPPYIEGNIEYQHVHAEIPPLPGDIDRIVTEIVYKCMAKKPADRFQSISELIQEINNNASDV
ncbi:molecular chaperone DnaK [Candidatus Sumerlaeota bacterium]|nr:molecular chaperone DnaK [Candidatus Sumerlaeota bacterium]